MDATTGGTGGAMTCEELTMSGPQVAQDILAMGADTWMQIPDSKLLDVCPQGLPDIQGVVGCEAVVSAWGGSALDPTTSRLYTWGAATWTTTATSPTPSMSSKGPGRG